MHKNKHIPHRGGSFSTFILKRLKKILLILFLICSFIIFFRVFLIGNKLKQEKPSSLSLSKLEIMLRKLDNILTKQKGGVENEENATFSYEDIRLSFSLAREILSSSFSQSLEKSPSSILRLKYSLAALDSFIEKDLEIINNKNGNNKKQIDDVFKFRKEIPKLTVVNKKSDNKTSDNFNFDKASNAQLDGHSQSLILPTLPYKIPVFAPIPLNQILSELNDNGTVNAGSSRSTSSRSRYKLNPLINSIFVTIASYRDEQCAPTIVDMYEKARNPHGVFVGVIEQHLQRFDPSCVPIQFMTDECHRRNTFCPADNIRVRRISPGLAKGPTFGRYLGMMLYQGEEYMFMMDSHNRFVTGWDAIVVNIYLKLQASKNYKKVALSHYPEAWNNPEDDPNVGNIPLDNRPSTAFLCKASYLQWGMPRLDGIVISRPKEPLEQPWAAAGFIFADATILSDVPFDPYLDYVFDGEEVTYSVRLWTHGWNMYSPPENIIYHYYGRKNAKRFWGLLPLNWASRKTIAENRMRFIINATEKGPKQAPLVTVPPSVTVNFSPYASPWLRFIKPGFEMSDHKELPRFEDKSITFNSEKAMEVARKDKTLYFLRELHYYGLGSVRSINEYYKFSKLDRENRTVNDHFCHQA